MIPSAACGPIELIPDGRYFFEDVMEDDEITDQPYTIKAEVPVKGSDLIVDYHGSSSRAKGPINGTLGIAHGAAYNAILQPPIPPSRRTPAASARSACWRRPGRW